LHLLRLLRCRPPIELSPTTRLAKVLLGDIDVRGVRGPRRINVLLASALTEWRIRLREIARSPTWKALQVAQQEHMSVPANVHARVPKGLAVEVYGLNALLPIGQVRGVRRSTPPEQVNELLRARVGQEIRVTLLRLDPDSGHIFVSERPSGGRQLRLPLLEAPACLVRGSDCGTTAARLGHSVRGQQHDRGSRCLPLNSPGRGSTDAWAPWLSAY
jgi:hypothetical protein